MKKLYNNDNSKHSDLLNDLKSLPKISAPENFEFNLMTRIQNKNFGNIEGEKRKFNFLKFFAPSAAVAMVLILFFVFYPQADQVQKQLATQNSVGDSQTVINSAINHAKASLENKTIRKSLAKQNFQNSALPSSPGIVTQNKIPFPLNMKKSVSVDDYISGAKSNSNHLQGGSTVNSGDQPYSGEFLIEKKTDKETLERYRDSLRRVQQIADSLKKVQK